MNKAKIAQSLMGSGNNGLGSMFANKLNKKMEQDYLIHDEMERKRREEESLKAQQDRERSENMLKQQNSLRV